MKEQMDILNDNRYGRLNESIKDLSQKLGANLRTSDKDDPQKYNGAVRYLTQNRKYMAITRPEENFSGGYSGLSFVLFPIKEDATCPENVQYTCVVSICIGTSDLGEDEELAALPYLRRSYTKLLSEKTIDRGFIKTSFTDTITESVALFEYLEEGRQSHGWTLDEILKYKKLLPASIVITFNDENIKKTLSEIEKNNKLECDNDFVILAAWLAQYAKVRGWGYNNTGNNKYNRQDNLIQAVCREQEYTEDKIENELADIIESNRFMVIQGAPGTGKTRAALRLAENKHYKLFFTQFHADTTYADFVGGIRPILNSNGTGHSQVGYTYKEGKLTEAIAWATDHPKDKVLLVIDEINRANLQNVVGPMFYLFERRVNENMEYRNQAKIKLEREKGDPLELDSLPENMMVVATMNTSDRSLAIVDFALRRRFVWYTMPVLNLGKEVFGDEYNENLFHKISDLFDKYATDEELSLQPGHSYFKASDKDTMKSRLEYEIMPLMKEYFANGLMLAARDEFADLFFKEVGKFMYR